MKPDKRALTQSGGSFHIGGNMLRFFLFDWILTYLETPEIYRTAGDEVLFYTALAIVGFTLIGVYLGIATAVGKYLKHRNNKR